jgi:protocatechuate 3,4-dioxygenase, alpha subunit
MVQSLGYLKETPSQTAGPYVHIGLLPHQAGFQIFQKDFGNTLYGPTTRGDRITIEGRVIDGAGEPLRDALLEIWQANSEGRYNHPADTQPKALDADFRGWGRTSSDAKTGIYVFHTIKPGAVVSRRVGQSMAPHVSFWIVARGINIGLSTRMYFSDEAAANAVDPVLNLIEQKTRSSGLIAERSTRDGQTIYTFDIHLQGQNETVFFDI